MRGWESRVVDEGVFLLLSPYTSHPLTSSASFNPTHPFPQFHPPAHLPPRPSDHGLSGPAAFFRVCRQSVSRGARRQELPTHRHARPRQVCDAMSTVLISARPEGNGAEPHLQSCLSLSHHSSSIFCPPMLATFLPSASSCPPPTPPHAPSSPSSALSGIDTCCTWMARL